MSKEDIGAKEEKMSETLVKIGLDDDLIIPIVIICFRDKITDNMNEYLENNPTATKKQYLKS